MEIPDTNGKGIRLYTFYRIRYNKVVTIRTNYIKKAGGCMSLEEQTEIAINRFVDLMRIKAHETGENKELAYQIKVAKVKLASFGINYSELEL